MVEVVCGVGGRMFAKVEENIVTLESEFRCDLTIESNGKSSPRGPLTREQLEVFFIAGPCKQGSLGDELGITKALNR